MTLGLDIMRAHQLGLVRRNVFVNSLMEKSISVNDIGTPTYTRATSAYDPITNSIKGAGVRRRRPLRIGASNQSMDLIEGTRTNLLNGGFSEHVERWNTTTNVTFTQGATAPDGSATAVTVTATASVSTNLNSILTATAPATGTHVYSFHVKAGTYAAPKFILRNSTTASNIGSITVNFPARTLTVSAGTASIISDDGTWMRIQVSSSSITSGDTLAVYSAFPGNAQTAGDSATVWGHQVELGSFASSYISNRNLLVRTEELGSWTLTDSTVTADSTANPLTGLVTADTVTEGSAGTALIARTVTVVAGQTVTGSFNFLKGNTNILRFQIDSGGANGFRCWVNVNTGAIGTAALMGTGTYTSSSITSLGSGWYKVVMTGTIAAAATSLNFVVSSASADASTTRVNGATYIAWGAQLEYGSAATSYWANSTAVGLRASDALTSSLTSIVDTRRNLGLYSEQQDNAAWAKTGAAVTANTTTDPNGNAYADTITEDGSTGGHLAKQAIVKAASAIQYTFGICVKVAVGTRNVRLRMHGSLTADSAFVMYNTSTGAVASAAQITGNFTGPSSTATSLGSGWWFFTLTATSDTSVGLSFEYALLSATTVSYAGDSTSALYTFGAQLVAAASLLRSEYVATAGTAQTADVTGLSITQGTIHSLVIPYGWTGDQDGTLVWTIARSGASSDFRFDRSNSNTARLIRTDSGAAQQMGAVHGLVANALSHLALVYDSASVRGFVAGVLTGAPDTSLAAPYVAVTSLDVGSTSGTSGYFYGWVCLLYFHQKALNAQEESILVATTPSV